jgi:oligopeptidase A
LPAAGGSGRRAGASFSPVSHLNSVKNSPELREAYEQTLPLLSEYSTWVGQHEGLYKAYRDLRDGDHYATLNTAQKKRSITRCVILNCPVLAWRKSSRNATAKSPRASPSWATSTATTCSTPPWAGPSW